MQQIAESLEMVVMSVIFVAGVALLLFLSRGLYRSSSMTAKEVTEKQSIIQERTNINNIGAKEIQFSSMQVFNDILSMDLSVDIYVNGTKIDNSKREKATINGDTKATSELKKQVEDIASGHKFTRTTKYTPTGVKRVDFKKV